MLTSTSSVYGNSPRSPFREDDPADRPLSPYAATKRATEVIAHSYHNVYGLPVTILRLFSVYGPRGRPDMTPALFVMPVWRGEPLVQFGDGSAGRNYTYIDDIVAGYLAAVDRPLGYEIINLANSQEVTLAAYFRVLGELLERPLRIEQRPMPASDPERTRADIGKARRLLGYEPRTSFPTGLGRYLDWFRAELAAVPRLPRADDAAGLTARATLQPIGRGLGSTMLLPPPKHRSAVMLPRRVEPQRWRGRRKLWARTGKRKSRRPPGTTPRRSVVAARP